MFAARAYYRGREFSDQARLAALALCMLATILSVWMATLRARRRMKRSLTFTAPGLRRQSLFGKSVPHPEIPAWLPRPFRLHRRCPSSLPILLPLVQLRASPLRSWLDDPCRGSSRKGRRSAGPTPDRAAGQGEYSLNFHAVCLSSPNRRQARKRLAVQSNGLSQKAENYPRPSNLILRR